MKQETLEEVAVRLYPIILEDDGWDKNKQYRDEWIEGVKWQQEQDENKFSEKDLRKTYMVGKHGGTTQTYYEFKELLEQFKKK